MNKKAGESQLKSVKGAFTMNMTQYMDEVYRSSYILLAVLTSSILHPGDLTIIMLFGHLVFAVPISYPFKFVHLSRIVKKTNSSIPQ